MIVNHWPDWFRALCFVDGELPRTYCAVDVETTGYSFDRDVITEWGHCLVRDGQVVNRLSLVLDWTNHHIVPDHWLRDRLRYVRQSMELAGARCHMSYERMKAEGRNPEAVLAFIRDFTSTLQRNGVLFAAHGGTFDEKMISSNLIGFKVQPQGFSFGDNGLLDTEGIEKASQCPHNPRMHPKKGDSLRSYFHRVKYTRVEGCKSNLDQHCHHKYLEKHGIDRREMHGAYCDSYCVHLLLEEFRGLLSAKPLDAPIFPTEDHKAARRGEVLRPSLPQPSATRIRGQRRS